MTTVCFSSIKGGTGKSSLCILMANHVAATGYRVLVADLDLQNSTTTYYLDELEPAERHNIASALHRERLTDNIIPSNFMGIDLLASSMDLVELRTIDERTLKRLIDNSELPYDFLFLDTAPTYDNLVLNALHASNLIITPVLFSQFDYKGCLFYRAMIRRDTDKLYAWRILFNFYKTARSSNPKTVRNQYESLFRSTFDDVIIPVTVPESALVRRSIDTGKKITGSASETALHASIEALATYLGATRLTGR